MQGPLLLAGEHGEPGQPPPARVGQPRVEQRSEASCVVGRPLLAGARAARGLLLAEELLQGAVHQVAAYQRIDRLGVARLLGHTQPEQGGEEEAVPAGAVLLEARRGHRLGHAHPRFPRERGEVAVPLRQAVSGARIHHAQRPRQRVVRGGRRVAPHAGDGMAEGHLPAVDRRPGELRREGRLGPAEPRRRRVGAQRRGRLDRGIVPARDAQRERRGVVLACPRPLVERAGHHDRRAGAERPPRRLARPHHPGGGVLDERVPLSQGLPRRVGHQGVDARPRRQQPLDRAAHDDPGIPQARGRPVVGDQHALPEASLAERGRLEVHPQGPLEAGQGEGPPTASTVPSRSISASTSSVPAAVGSR